MPTHPGLKRGKYKNRTGAADGRTVLPVETDLPAPPLPPGRTWTDVEGERWATLWSSPQASQWDSSVAGTVALLVAYETQLLAGKGSAWLAAEARYAAESLGLTPRSMAALGWTIEREEDADA